MARRQTGLGFARAGRALLLLPAVVYVGVVLGWAQAGAVRLTGDEPHYLVIADSIARDFDLDVRNNYERDAETGAIHGPIDWHSMNGSGGRYSDHGPGLPALLAPAFVLGGALGARIFLALLVGLLPIAFFAAARRQLGEGGAVLIALTLSLGLPFTAAAGQLYPDVLTGLCVLTALLLIDAERRSSSPLRTLALAILLFYLPWLHLKNQAPALLLLVAWAVVRVQGAATRDARLAAVWPCLVPVAAMLALAAYHVHAFGDWTGPFRPGAQDAPARRIVMVLFGLHLDQSQGMFVQQPLLWFGLVGLGFFALRERSAAIFVAVVYASMIVPNAMHLNTYGGWSFAGRFGWSSAPLWIFPLTAAFAWLGRRRLAWLGLLSFAALWSAWLATTWVPTPAVFYPQGRTEADRSTLVGPLRDVLPSFVDPDGFESHLPNWVFVWLAVLLLGFGIDRALCREAPEAGRDALAVDRR
jgi:hypothetical protein